MKSSRSDKLSVAATSKDKKKKGPKTVGFSAKMSSELDIKENCTFVLSLLDGMKDALFYRGGRSGDTPYFVRTAALNRLTSTKVASLLRIQSVSLNCSSEGDFRDHLKRLEKRKDPSFDPTAEYLKLDYQSGASAIYFYIAILELFLDAIPKIVEIMDSPTMMEPFIWLAGLDPLNFVGYAKYITAYPMAAYLKQADLPEPPVGFPDDRKLLFLGKMKKLVRNRLVSFTRHNSSLFQGLLQGVKRAALAVPSSYIANSLKKHALTLTRPSRYRSMNVRTPWALVEEENNFEHMFSLKMKRMASGFQMTEDEISNVAVPSSSAAFEQTAQKGGALRFLQGKYVTDTIEAISQRESLGLRKSIEEDKRALRAESKKGGIPFETLYQDWIGSGGLNPEHPGFLLAPADFMMMYSDLSSTTHFYGFPLPTVSLEGFSLMDKLFSEVKLTYFEEEEQFVTDVPSFGESFLETEKVFVQKFRPRRYISSKNPSYAEEFKAYALNSSLSYDASAPEEYFYANESVPFLPPCSVIPLSEPLKVRIITTGSAELYYLCKNLQIKLWDHLQMFPQFNLTGEPLREEHLFDLISQEAALEQKLMKDLQFDQFVSGDYSAATDNLDIHYTLLCYDAMAKEATSSCFSDKVDEYFSLVRLALSEHDMRYDSNECPQDFIDTLLSKGVHVAERAGKYNLSVRQTNGQLMGSPLSFPFLCMINLIVYWISLEEYCGMKIKPRDLPVKVNGDDILFRANDKFYRIWKANVSRVSFLLSLGKNYIHRSILTVNSVMYNFTIHNQAKLDRTKYTFEEIKYFNIGLLTAQSKSTMRDVQRNLPLADVYEIVIGGAHDKVRAHKRFLHYNKLAISKMTDFGKFNLFIPVHLGGLGFRIFPEVFSGSSEQTTRVYDPLVSMTIPKEIRKVSTPLITTTPFQRRFATFIDYKVRESLGRGVYPKKYMSALVDDSGSVDISKHVVHENFYKLRFAEFGPLPEDQLDFKEKTIDQHPLTSLNLKAGQKPDLQYRLPSRRILQEFNTFNNLHLGIASSTLRQQMGEQDLLFGPKPRVVRVLDLNRKPEFPEIDLDPLSYDVLKHSLYEENWEDLEIPDLLVTPNSVTPLEPWGPKMTEFFSL